MSRFHVADYVVFGVTIAASLAIGLVFAFKGRKQSSNNDYLMGGRNMNLLPIALSLIVTYQSSIEMVGNPAEVYAYGAQYMLYLVAIVVGVIVGTYVFVPLYYPLKITSVFEYHEMRFQRKYVEITSVIFAMLSMIIANGMLIFTPCLAFQTVSGFPARASMVITGFVGLIYTTLGGMKAVVWTDVFQAFVIFVGLLIIVVRGTLQTGGVQEVWSINKEWGRMEFFDFRFDPTIRLTFWNVVVLNSVLYTVIATAQPSVQRFMALPTMKKAKISSLILVPGLLTSGMLSSVVGVTAFAYYAKRGCDPVSAGIIMSPNEILPHFVMDVMNVPGLPGVFVACLFCASLSTVSSCYSAMAAITWQNVLRLKLGHLSPPKQANICKVVTLVMGGISIGTAFLLIELGGTIIQIAYSILGSLGGPMVAVSFIGGLIPRAGPRGVMVGMVVSLAFCMWLNFGAMFNKQYDPPLPGPTHNCSVPDSNTSSLILTNLTHKAGTILDILETTSLNASAPPQYVQTQTKKTALEWMYSISYFWYPTIAIIITVIVSVIFLIPGLDIPMKTPKYLLFPFARPCCGAEGKFLADEVKISEMKPLGTTDEDIDTKPKIFEDDEDTKEDEEDEESVVWVKNKNFKCSKEPQDILLNNNQSSV